MLLPLHKSSRGDAWQMGDRPVVDVTPGLLRCFAVTRHAQHLPEIFGRLGEPLAAGFVHVEFAQAFGRLTQPVEFAEYDIIRVVGQHQPGIMLHQIEPAPAARIADKIGATRQELRHRVVEATHQGAVDEETIGVHAHYLHRHCERSEAIHEAACDAVDCFVASAPRNDERTVNYAATTSSLITTNLTRSIRPKLVVSATSAASRPVPIRMRPMRGWLWRGGGGVA